MKEFKKLNREEMKKVLGGVGLPSCPENACGGTAGKCEDGKTCHSATCPNDSSFYYNYCS